MTDTLRLGKSPKLLDLELIENGVRREAPMAPGVFVTIYPWASHSPRFRKALQSRALRDVAEGTATPTDVESASKYLQRKQEDPEFIADGIVGTMEGLLDGDFKPVEYTRERGLKLLVDPELVHFRDWIVGEAYALAGRYKEEVDASGNGSRPTSRGKRGGAAKSGKTRS